MVQYIEINGTEYPILFSFRAIFSFMSNANLSSIQDAEKRVNLDLDSLLELYEEAFKKGAKKDDSFKGKPLSAEDIEDAFDENPQLFMKLQELFNQSKVMRSMAGEEIEDEKK